MFDLLIRSVLGQINRSVGWCFQRTVVLKYLQVAKNIPLGRFFGP